MEQIPSLDGWQAYCDTCRVFREAGRAQEWDVGTHEEYSILLSIHRSNPMDRLTPKPNEALLN
jgi:hypothetical protein